MPKDHEPRGAKELYSLTVATGLTLPVHDKFQRAFQLLESMRMDELDKVGVTFLVATEMVAVTLFCYRMSDGVNDVRWNLEERLWKYGVPIGNFVGAAFILANMWR